jgi:PAS domain S-box-containing protein
MSAGSRVGRAQRRTRPPYLGAVTAGFLAAALGAAALHLLAPFATPRLEQVLVASAWLVASGAAVLTAVAVAVWTRDAGLRRAWLFWALAGAVWLTGAAARLVDVATGVPYLDLAGDLAWFAAPLVAIASIGFDARRGSLSFGLFLLDAIPPVLLGTMIVRLVGPFPLVELQRHEFELVGYPALYLLLALVGLQMLALERPRAGSPNVWGFGVSQPLLFFAAATWPAYIAGSSLVAAPPWDALWSAGFLAAGCAALRRAHAVNAPPKLTAFDDSGLRVVAPAVGTLGLAVVSLVVPLGYSHIPAALAVVGVVCFIARAQVVRAESRRAQAGLVESERKLRTLVSNVPGAVYRCELGGDYTIDFVSDEIEAVTGYPAADFLETREQTFATIEHPDDEDAFERHIREKVAAGEPFAYEYRIVHADGGVRWVLDKGQAAYGPNGEVLWIDGVLVDISERKRAEAELEIQTGLLHLLQRVAVAANEADEIEDALRACIDEVCTRADWPIGHALLRVEGANELAPTGIWRLDDSAAARTFRAASEACRFARGVGLPGRALATGEPVWLVDPAPSDLPGRGEAAQALGVRTALAFPVLVGSEVVAVLEFFSPGATPPDTRTLGAMANVGAVLGRVVERRRAEAALEAQNEQLRQLDALKDEFVSLVSHELRTPLTSIRGYLELVLDDADSLTAEQRKFLEVVQRNAQRLLQLVSDLLFVAQVDAGRLSVEHEDVDLATVAEESVQAAEPNAAANGVRLVLETKPAHLAGDRARLAQLVDNLVSNAIKFTRTGGSVTVRVGPTEGGVALEVADSGIGIPADEQDQLFERFFRSTNARRAAIQGTGLGLVIVRAISDAHGGTVSLESAEGVGTTFRIELPESGSGHGEPEPMLEVA